MPVSLPFQPRAVRRCPWAKRREAPRGAAPLRVGVGFESAGDTKLGAPRGSLGIYLLRQHHGSASSTSYAASQPLTQPMNNSAFDIIRAAAERPHDLCDENHLSGRVWGAGAGLPGRPDQDNKPRYALPQF